MTDTPRLLIVEDSEDDALLLVLALRQQGFAPDFRVIDSEADLRHALAEDEWDLVLSDYALPGFGGKEALRLVKESGKDLPFIVVSGTIGEELAVECMRAGASDYLMKDRLTRLGPAVARELADLADRRRQRAAEAALAEGKARAEEYARESEARFGVMADHAPVLIWMADELGHASYVNRGWLEFRGKTLEEELGAGWQKGVHPEDWPALEREYLAAVREQRKFTAEYRLKRADGSWRWVLDTGVPRALPAGGVGFIGTCVDITDRKTAEKEREALLREAQQANRLKDEFLATLSHELRTPMNAITGWAELLDRGELDPEDHAEAFEVIHRNAVLQNKLINDLLDISKIVTGKLAIETRPVDLAGVARAALESVRLSAQARDMEVAVRAAPTGLVLGDAARLQQVVWNLLSNAIKFTPKGGRVSLEVGREGGAAMVRVTDSGEGIDPAFLPYVFDRFRQQDSSMTRRHGGLGLGLAIVRHLVEQHGGQVTAESGGKGKGATFTVRLPLVSSATAQDQAEAETRARLAATAPLRGLRVLIVDDQDDVLALLARILGRHGAEVLQAQSVPRALECVRAERPDVVLSDLSMPVQDGFDFIRELRKLTAELGHDVPAVALTGHARDEDTRQALAAGFRMHVAKPIESASLVRAVAQVAGRPPPTLH